MAEDERRAWAGLVAAHIEAIGAAKARSERLERRAAEDIARAEQALRDPGVDAHALVLEAIHDPERFLSATPDETKVEP